MCLTFCLAPNSIFKFVLISMPSILYWALTQPKTVWGGREWPLIENTTLNIMVSAKNFLPSLKLASFVNASLGLCVCVYIMYISFITDIIYYTSHTWKPKPNPSVTGNNVGKSQLHIVQFWPQFCHQKHISGIIKVFFFGHKGKLAILNILVWHARWWAFTMNLL